MAREYLGNGNWVEWSNEIKNARIYILEENTMSETAKELYNHVKDTFEGVDAIYVDSLINLIGTYGVYVLHINKLIESCGMMNGRQLYTLCDLKGDD